MQWFTKRIYINTLMLIALTVLASSVFIAYQQIQRLIEAESWVVHSHEVIERLDEAILSNTIAESKIHDFLLSNDANNIKNLATIYAVIEENLTRLNELVRDNPKQIQSLNQLKGLIKPKIKALNEVIEVYSRDGKQAAINLALSPDSQTIRQNILFTAKNMIHEELALLALRQENTNYNAHRANVMLIGSGGLGILLLLFSFFLLNYHLIERERAERERQDIENRLKIIIDNSSDLIAALDLDFKFIAFNVAYEKKFKEFFGKKIKTGMKLQEALVEYADRDAIIDMWQRALAGEEFTIVSKFKSDKEEGRFYEATFSTIRNAFNKSFGASHIMRDITERRKVEQLKNEFVSVVSHELRTPLTSIRGSLGLVINGVMGVVDDKIKHMLNIAYNNCGRLEHLINDILDIEKIESDKITFELSVIELNKFIEEAIEINRSFSEEFDVKIAFIPAPHDLFVKADYGRLMQVFTNLISNAVKFSPLGAKVEVVVSQQENVAKVAVIDHGEGVPQDFQKHIFEKFSQAESSSIRKFGGSGLGLNISKTIIKKMNGDLNFSTQPQLGSVFYFTLPITHERFENAVTEEALLQNANKVKLLYLEDDEELSEIIEKMLHSEVEVIRVETVLEAMKELKKQTFDVALVDFMLSEGDSIGLFPELKKLDIPIIVFTAYDFPTEYAAFVSKVLIKSKTTNANLISAIREAVAKKKPQQLHNKSDKD